MIDKETLLDLYKNKRLTTYEIAELFSVSRKTISRWLKFYDIDINPKKRKFEHIKKVPLTKEQKELIIGTLLGDGCIAPHGNMHRLVLGQCEKQKEYLFWKKSILGNFINNINVREDKRKNSIMYTCCTVTHNEFRFYYNLFYENCKKIIRPEIVNYLSPLALSVWFCDDGSINKKVNMRFATDGFSKEENEILQEALRLNFNIRCKVCEYTRNNKKYYFLSLNKENSNKLTEIIKPYVLDSLKYKLISSTTEC